MRKQHRMIHALLAAALAAGLVIPSRRERPGPPPFRM